MMIQPLYPPRPKKTKQAEPEGPPLWQNRHLQGAVAGIFLLVAVMAYHFATSQPKIDPTLPPAGQTEEKGVFSFLNLSRRWKETPTPSDVDDLTKMGIPSETLKIFAEVGADNFRDKRRLAALQKLEGVRRLGMERERRAEEMQKSRNSPTALRLKDAMRGLESMDSLGMMRLENLLNEELMSKGGRREDLDILIYAFQSLAKKYEERNMLQKAKEAHIATLRLMKEHSDSDQAASWDDAISRIENIPVKAPGH